MNLKGYGRMRYGLIKTLCPSLPEGAEEGNSQCLDRDSSQAPLQHELWAMSLHQPVWSRLLEPTFPFRKLVFQFVIFAAKSIDPRRRLSTVSLKGGIWERKSSSNYSCNSEILRFALTYCKHTNCALYFLKQRHTYRMIVVGDSVAYKRKPRQ
jgi:hypothetical protein